MPNIAAQLREVLGDRMSTKVIDVGNGPVLTYVIDGQNYDLERAAYDFLRPAPEPEAAPAKPADDGGAVSHLCEELGIPLPATAIDHGVDDMRLIAKRLRENTTPAPATVPNTSSAPEPSNQGRELQMLDSDPQESLW